MKLKTSQMVLCHTFMGSEGFINRFAGKTVVVTSYDEDKSLELARHYNFDKFNIKYLNAIELACIYYPSICQYLRLIPEFRDVYDS